MTKMLIITNAEGGIIGAAHVGRPAAQGPNVAIRPLPGQRVHQVDVPDEIARLTSGHHLHLALSHAHFDPATNKLTFKRITAKRLHP